MTLSEKMVLFRARNCLSQKKAAQLANITLQTWNQVEIGHQTPSRLTEAKILGIMNEVKNEDEYQQNQTV